MEHGFTIKDSIFLLLILLSIIGLFSAIITIKQNIVQLNNPMGTCMAKFNLNSCVCYEKGTNYPVTIRSINYTEYIPSESDKFRDAINQKLNISEVVWDKLNS